MIRMPLVIGFVSYHGAQDMLSTAASLAFWEARISLGWQSARRDY